MPKETGEEIQRLLKTVADHFDIEDRAVRERQLRTWRKLKLYWNGFQNIYYSEVAHDWRIWNDMNRAEENDQTYYDKPVNVFRAYLESIIAALSVTIPTVECFPDDADSPLDIETAKAGSKIAELIYKHNDASLLWLHALYVYCTEGMVACYSYPKEDDKFGTYEEPEYGEVEEFKKICPACGTNLADELFSEQEQDEFMPGDDDVDLHDLLHREGPLCPNCATMLDPELQVTPLKVTKIIGQTTKPKSRQCIEVYGGLYVKIPNYARKQEDIPYLRFSYESHYATVLERYPHLSGKIKGESNQAAGIYDPYETWARLNPQYNGEYPINTVTVNNYWLRPCSFNILPEDDAKRLKQEFPDGCHYVKVNEQFAQAENESLDDCWTLTYNPLSDYLYHDPLGLLLTSIQDITNDLVSLTLQTIEHGIPQTFADPDVLNFDQYRQTETTPGAIYPVKARSGKAVGESFYEVKTATLSGEILPFGQNVQQLGQLVSGALPSLFGGSSEGGKTASEYAMSRAQALQRLQTPWKSLTLWWKNIFGKVIPSFIKDMATDERFVQKDSQGNFFNVFIRQAELQGKLGEIELEASEQLPTTWAQKKDVIFELLKLNNPAILEALTLPENIEFVSEALGLSEFVLPGTEDRIKQLDEIKQLMVSEPIENIDPMSGQAMPMPSVQVEPQLDNNQLEAEICRGWLVGPAGRLARTENPKGYMNVLLHMKMHLMAAMPPPMMNPQMQQGANPRIQEPQTENVKAPIKGDSDAGRYIQ